MNAYMRRPLSAFLALAILVAGALAAPVTALAESPAVEVAQVEVVGVQSTTALAEGLFAPGNLVIGLSKAIVDLSSYPTVQDFPRIARVSHAALEARACGGRCRYVRAAYVPGDGIYLDDSLDPERSAMDRSIVLHELVHYVQDLTHRYGHLGDCERRRAEELEAYAIQNAYLASLRVMPGIHLPSGAFQCEEAAADPPHDDIARR